MPCISCHSTKQVVLPAELNIHFSGLENLDKPSVFAFPSIFICLNCGHSQFTLLSLQVRQLKDLSGLRAQEGKAARAS